MTGVPTENTVLRCRSCGMQIFFARTQKMMDMPLDAKPVKVFEVLPLAPGETKHKCRIVEMFVSHFSTCPNADDWRKHFPGKRATEEGPRQAEVSTDQGEKP